MAGRRLASAVLDAPRPDTTAPASHGPGRGGSTPLVGSVTGAVMNLRAADPGVRNEAARRIWERFSARLCAVVRGRLNPRIRTREDEDDIVQRVFENFFAGQQDSATQPKNREELWRLLVWMTMCKVANAAHHHCCKVRDVRVERPLGSRGPDSASATSWLVEIEDRGSLSPSDAAISRMELAWVLLRLRKDLRQIIIWRLEGFTNAEIGGKINRTERTVEMKMRLIRQTLEHDPLVQRALDGGRARRPIELMSSRTEMRD